MQRPFALFLASATICSFRLPESAGNVRSGIREAFRKWTKFHGLQYIPFATLGDCGMTRPSRNANAAGYCHWTDTFSGSMNRTVYFSDEVTTRMDWT